MRLSRRPALFGALALSFAIYLVPVLNIHAGWVSVGSMLVAGGTWSELSLAMVAAGLALQALSGAVLYGVLRSRWPLALVLAAAALPLFVLAANWTLLEAVPRLVLVERDPGRETGTLALVCTVPDAAVEQVRSGADLALVRAGEAWLVSGPERRRSRLAMPGCVVAAVAAPQSGLALASVAPGGHLLYREEAGGLQYKAPGAEVPRPLPAPPGVSYWDPILSDDGRAAVWLDRMPGAGGPGTLLLRLRDLSNGNERALPLDLPPRDQYTLIGATGADGPFTLARFRNAVLSIDAAGAVRHGPVSPDGVYNTRWGFRWVAGGWVAWDGYREEGRSRIVWDLPGGQGKVVVPKGQRIDSVSVAADGRVIAAATSSHVRVGRPRSAVFLVRTRDGVENFRRFQPEFFRATLAFLGDHHLAITRLEAGRVFVDVYHVPRGPHD